MKNIFVFLFSFFVVFNIKAQPANGSIAPDFSAVDLGGNNLQLYATLSQGKTVVLHFFATWDSFSWDYAQSGELQAFTSLYGPDGNGSCEIWSIESEALNSLAQLQGPEAITGNLSTQTYGDWITNNNVSLIDDASIAALFGLNSLPAVLIICPDALVLNAGEFSASALNTAIETGCDQLSVGYDPAIVSSTLLRSCGDVSGSTEVVIKNLGTEPLESLNIQLFGALNNPVFEWDGSLDSYQSDTVIFNGIELVNDDSIYAKVVDVNVNASNDSVLIATQVTLSMMTVQLELALDAYPEEVSWQIRNDQDSVIFSDGSFEIDYEYFNVNFELPASGCYVFELFDTGGDGLHGSQYGGFNGSCYLRSIDDAGNVSAVIYANNGSYNFVEDSEIALFEAGSPLDVASLSGRGLNVYPNPAVNSFRLQWQDSNYDQKHIRIYDVSGKILYDDYCAKPSEEIVCNDWSEGLYTVVVVQNREVQTMKILVSH
jgi:hypothetical protein